MPKKYHIDVRETPHRFPVIGRSGIVDWGEGCLKCPVCVKQECVYNVYKKRSFSPEICGDTIDDLCKDCFRCVQGCPKRLIHKTMNPEWEALGNDVYTPEIISTNWEQARTGKIPVSGAGYGGPFAGAGFDSMWTDMSEIVRPTRDGIHGREYISTVVDIGSLPGMLKFDSAGKLDGPTTPTVRIPIPIVFDLLPFGDLSPAVYEGFAAAAAQLGTRFIVPEGVARDLGEFRESPVPYLDGESFDADWIASFDMVEIPDSPSVFERMAALKEIKPDLIVSVRVPALLSLTDRVVELVRGGVPVIHGAADERGFEPGLPDGAHVKDFIRSVHSRLLSEGIRDTMTFIVSGGVAMAEHVIKSMLCGANLTAVDIPLLLALECRMCGNCAEDIECPVDMAHIAPEWATRRVLNLIGSWHNQLLEMMGAMGIREARRLRGEHGRLMFIEDLEADTFGRIFGPAGA